MTFAGSVAPDATLRLFCAFELPDDIRRGISRWATEHVTVGRRVTEENLHMTLAFLGARPAGDLAVINTALRESAAEQPVGPLRIERWHTTRAVGMLVLADPSGGARRFQTTLVERLVGAGLLRREARPWLPHITVTRLRRAARLEPPLPDNRTFVPSDAAAFLSRLHPHGAHYEALVRVPLDPLTQEETR